MHHQLDRDGPAVATSRRLRVAALVTTLAVAAGCTDAGGPEQLVAPARTFRGLTHSDSIARGYFAPRPGLRTLLPGTRSAELTETSPTIVSVSPSNFQGASQPGTITITLTGNVGSLTVVGSGAIQCSGSYGTLIAYDANGAQLASSPLQLIDPADCSPAENPDNVTYGAQGTVSVAFGIIAKVELTPMSPLTFDVLGSPGRASQTYDISVGPGTPLQCVPTGDPILDEPGIVSDFVSALNASNPNATPGTGVKHESGGGIFQRADGTYYTVPAVDPGATECHFDPLKISQTPPAGETGMLVGIYHTHPSALGEDVYGCTGKGVKQAQTKGDGLPVPTAAPDTNGGGSDADWDGTFGFASYTINKDGSIWKLDGSVAKKDRSKNTNRYDFKNAAPGCVKK
jgi:hypothetical protein